VLPDVVADERDLALEDGGVLVGRGGDLQLAAVEHEPDPARSEPRDARGLELLLEGVEGAEGGGDRGGQLARGLAAAVRAHGLPEQGVVEVAAAVVAERALLVGRQRVERPQDLLDRLALVPGALEGGVGLVDVRLVVLVVVHAHRRLVDVRLQGVVVVRQGGDLVGHRFLLWS
jgi:hypothetical protein